MRKLIVSKGTNISLRADEIDWFPTSLHEYTFHLLLNEEDFCANKTEKLKLRRQRRKDKYLI